MPSPRGQWRTANSGEKKKKKTGREVICGAPTTLAVKGWVKVKVKTFF